MNDTNKTEVIAMAEDFISLLQNNDHDQAISCMLNIQANLDDKGNDNIVLEIGKIALNISESVKSICKDPRLHEISADDVTSSIERLKSVAKQSEVVALETIAHVEKGKPLVNWYQEQAGELLRKVEAEKNDKSQVILSDDYHLELVRYLKNSQTDMATLQKMFTEILMAQSMQDLSGQVINKVLNLISLTQSGLIELIKRAKGLNVGSENNGKENIQEFLQAGEKWAIGDQGDIDELLSDLGT
jgi:chemotaxis protein CheZ